MRKLQELKEAIKKTPPERLAKIEYQSHFMQMIGVSIVSGILIWKGFWWVIFAFVFSIFISLSQGIGAYQKYTAIKEIVGEKKYDPLTDKSFTRKRDYYIKKMFGKYIWTLAVILSVALNLMYVEHSNWWQNIIFSFSLLFFYIVIYFFFFYSVVKLFGGIK